MNKDSSQDQKQFVYITLTLLIIVIFRGAFSVVACDDAFITFRYSENIAAGKGFVYNDGEKILGTSTPLFTLLLALFKFFGLDIVFTSHVLSILFHFAVSFLILLILRSHGHYVSGVIGSFCFALDRLVMTAYGMETNLYVALLLVSLYYLLKTKIIYSVLYASLMTLCRADGGIWLLIIFIFIFIKNNKVETFKTLILAFLILVPWFLFSFFYFGTLFPHTVSVKIMNVSYFSNSFFSAIPFYMKEFYSYFILVAILGLFFSFKSREFILLIFIFDVVYILIFAILRAQHSHWYFIPLVPAIYIFFGRAIEEFISRIFELENMSRYNSIKKMVIMIPAFLVAFFAIKFILNTDMLGVADTRSKAFYYAKAGSWLKDNTTPDSEVMLGEIGIIGYYSKMKVVDMAGLVTILDDLQDRSTGAIASYFEPDYYVTGVIEKGRDISLGNTAYRMVAVTEGNMGIYRRTDANDHQNVETIRENDTINDGDSVEPPQKLDFLRDFTGRD